MNLLLFFKFLCFLFSRNLPILEDETLDINVKSAIVFVITASSFLVLLYFFMSSWFVWLLIVMFCIGGVEVMTLLLHVDFEICAKLG